jgi:hypothetical protein
MKTPVVDRVTCSSVFENLTMKLDAYNVVFYNLVKFLL